MAGTFALALEDYYGAVATATSGGTCSLNSPSNDILLSEAGRFAPIQSGVSTFTQFEVTGDLLYCLLLQRPLYRYRCIPTHKYMNGLGQSAPCGVSTEIAPCCTYGRNLLSGDINIAVRLLLS